ncbi:hypothetical protein ACJX0J_013242, partial [Zea mays]
HVAPLLWLLAGDLFSVSLSYTSSLTVGSQSFEDGAAYLHDKEDFWKGNLGLGMSLFVSLLKLATKERLCYSSIKMHIRMHCCFILLYSTNSIFSLMHHTIDCFIFPCFSNLQSCALREAIAFITNASC